MKFSLQYNEYLEQNRDSMLRDNFPKSDIKVTLSVLVIKLLSTDITHKFRSIQREAIHISFQKNML